MKVDHILFIDLGEFVTRSDLLSNGYKFKISSFLVRDTMLIDNNETGKWLTSVGTLVLKSVLLFK